MKKLISILTLVMTMTISASAMSYEQARQQALFLTDKMAYELNLNEAQYEAAYEVNLDYLMSINYQDDLYGAYWRQRNLDLSYILLDWQYRAFCAASYFYRPLYWHSGYWHFGIYARYPRRDYYYFGHPHFINVYVGGHSWHRNGGRSWYRGRKYVSHNNRKNYFGMRDSFKRGDYGKGVSGHFGNGQSRPTTGNRNNQPDKSGSFGSRPAGANNSTVTTMPASRFGGSRSGNTTSSPRQTSPSSNDVRNNTTSGSFGGSRAGSRTQDIGNSRGMLPNRTSGSNTTGSYNTGRSTTTGTSRSSSFGGGRNGASMPSTSRSSSFGSSRSSSPAHSSRPSVSSSRSAGSSKSAPSSSGSRFGGRR
ncbi:MAG: hypothetical protein ACI3YB_07270 [Prevotella sp.]